MAIMATRNQIQSENSIFLIYLSRSRIPRSGRVGFGREQGVKTQA